IPIRSAGGIHGLVCTLKRVDDVQDAEFTVRRRLHGQGFVAKYSFDDIMGRSSVLRACRERAVQFAGAPGPILITGESGTGKELFAHSIHRISPRAPFPFVALNCATLPSELLESELFGYEKGAFTGAQPSGKKGLIELAHKGTLFLDEVTSLSKLLQAKLLRLLSEQEILKLGSDHIIPVDIRIIAATNDDIDACVKECGNAVRTSFPCFSISYAASGPRLPERWLLNGVDSGKSWSLSLSAETYGRWKMWSDAFAFFSGRTSSGGRLPPSLKRAWTGLLRTDPLCLQLPRISKRP
ncbi:MAG: sigma 54-interacting transcriptional regulator, partial [Deltaproteobacteria bacterium]|nr:sigma 54-interacting transcriptional regulator [Deltaproteobacteria bacterium]